MTKRSAIGFTGRASIPRRLRHAAAVAVTDVLRAGKGERMLIITNPESEVSLISMALYNAALAVEAQPVVIFQPAKSQLDFADDGVIHALRTEPEIIVSVSIPVILQVSKVEQSVSLEGDLLQQSA